MVMQSSALCLNGLFGYEPGWRGWGDGTLGVWGPGGHRLGDIWWRGHRWMFTG